MLSLWIPPLVASITLMGFSSGDAPHTRPSHASSTPTSLIWLTEKTNLVLKFVQTDNFIISTYRTTDQVSHMYAFSMSKSAFSFKSEYSHVAAFLCSFSLSIAAMVFHYIYLLKVRMTSALNI
jgi:hypothetical protein